MNTLKVFLWLLWWFIVGALLGYALGWWSLIVLAVLWVLAIVFIPNDFFK